MSLSRSHGGQGKGALPAALQPAVPARVALVHASCLGAPVGVLPWEELVFPVWRPWVRGTLAGNRGGGRGTVRTPGDPLIPPAPQLTG